MLTNTSWTARAEIQREVTEDDLFILLPYPNYITIMRKHGGVLVRAEHDGADEGGDIDILTTLCLYRFNNGGQNV